MYHPSPLSHRDFGKTFLHFALAIQDTKPLRHKFYGYHIMKSTNGSFFGVSGPLCGDLPRSLVNSSHKGPVMRTLMFL